MTEQTIKCPICGDPFVFHSHYAGDQSACPKCRAKARPGGYKTRKVGSGFDPSESQRRDIADAGRPGQ